MCVPLEEKESKLGKKRGKVGRKKDRKLKRKQEELLSLPYFLLKPSNNWVRELLMKNLRFREVK